MDPLNLAILNTTDFMGGAALAARRLFTGLRQSGHQATLAVRFRKTNDAGVCRVRTDNPSMIREAEIFKDLEYRAIDQNRTNLSNTFFSLPYPGFDLSGSDLIEAADVVNLHWVAHFQSLENVSALLRLGKPVIWTLHDQNPFTGGCHYSAGCQEYTRECRDCPQLNENSRLFPARVLDAKLRLWTRGMTVVTPSRWLAECARNSRVLGRFRVETIPNSLDSDRFRPIAKERARQMLGVPATPFTLLLGAYTGNEIRKGFHLLPEMIRNCRENPRFAAQADAGQIQALIFGPGPTEDLGIPVRPLGVIEDESRLAAAYSAADLFVLPSLEDNLPNTLLESLACATPAVAFRVGGIPEVIEDGVNGRLVPAPDPAALGRAILDVFTDPRRGEEMGRNGRILIEARYRLPHQAGAYEALARELLGRRRSGGAVFPARGKAGSRETVVHDPEPPPLDCFFDFYRESALKLLTQKRRTIYRALKRLETSRNRTISGAGRRLLGWAKAVKRLLRRSRA